MNTCNMLQIRLIEVILDMAISELHTPCAPRTHVFWCGFLAACREIDGDAKRNSMRATRRGSFFLWRLIEGVIDTSMPGVACLAHACTPSRWRQARDGCGALLNGAEARGGRALFWSWGWLGWREEVIEAFLIWRTRGKGGGFGTTFG